MAKTGVKKGDRVAVMAGKEKGKRGKVLKTLTVKSRVVVEGLHLIKKTTRPSQKNPQGGIITREGSIHSSNVMIVCPHCDKPARVGHRTTNEGQKLRVCRGCGDDIDKE